MAGPTVRTQQTTLRAFREAAQANQQWSSYFDRAAACFARRRLQNAASGGDSTESANAFQAAVAAITEKDTVFIVYQEPDEKLPGDVPEYVCYLQSILLDGKYATSKVPPVARQVCSLCGTGSTTVYPNGLKGAGINIANLDRVGAFTGLDTAAAWKAYGLCGACADLLYVYKNYVANDYLTGVAGERALAIPSTQLDLCVRREFVAKAKKLVEGIETGQVRAREQSLLRLLADDVAVTEITFLWANFGQRIDEVQGIVSDVLPSRLRRIEEINRTVEKIYSPLFPEYPIDQCRYDLALSIIKPLFARPGGKAAEKANESKRLFSLKRELVAAIYHQRQGLPLRFWEEVYMTARWHLRVAEVSGDAWGLLNEGYSAKSGKIRLTMAGWVREFARFFEYLRKTGVMSMAGEPYRPKSEALKPYFTSESGIDSLAKAFSFILGSLYGKMMQVQAARGVNVGANALTWLKRLTLSGKDLPALYIKVREKLLAYETESNPTVREIVTELGELGAALGDRIELDETQTNYYLLLGQSLASRIMPTKSQKN
jgi:CRISPR-associated protein Csh1